MYAIVMDGIRYDGYTDGRPFTLVGALREVYGVAHCRILRLDGTLVVDNAGSATSITHAPTRRTLHRGRLARHLTDAGWQRSPFGRTLYRTAA